MMVYCKTKPTTLYNIEALLYVQEAQLDKFRQELSLSIPTANVAYSNQGRNARGCGRARGITSSTGNRPTCQLCGKYGHTVIDCWHRFDETFVASNYNAQGHGTPPSQGSSHNGSSVNTKEPTSTSGQATA